MPIPPNIDFPLATDLGTTLPVTVTEVCDDGATCYDVYFKYTAASTDTVLGCWAFGDLTVYKPTTEVYLGPASAPSLLGPASAFNVPFQFAVTPGTEYFFKVIRNAFNAVPANLTLNLQRFTATAVLPGYIGVPDDISGLTGLAILNPADGLPIAFFPDYVGADDGAQLANGVTAIRVTSTLNIYGPPPTFTLQATAVNPLNSSITSVTSDRSSRFYITGGSTTAKSIDPAGNVLGTWTLAISATFASGVHPSNTIFYYGSSAAAAQVRRFDLVNNIALTDLVAGVANYKLMKDMLVLSDGTILVGYTHVAPTPGCIIQHYSAAGAILTTYDFPTAGNAEARLAFATDSPASFWFWSKGYTGGTGNDAPGRATFRHIRVSDGALLSSVTSIFFEQGVYSAPMTDFPLARFGYSESCPFWILPEIASPTYTTRTVITRRQRTAPHLSQEQQWLYHARAQLDLQTGQGLVSGQGVNPAVMLEWSDDGGHTWSQEHWVNASMLGTYKARARWQRLGRSRDRIYRVTVSDPVAWHLVASYLQVELGTA